MTAFEAYQPFLEFAGFLGGWGLAMVTGLLFARAL